MAVHMPSELTTLLDDVDTRVTALMKERDALAARATMLNAAVEAANKEADTASGREFDAAMKYAEVVKERDALRKALREAKQAHMRWAKATGQIDSTTFKILDDALALRGRS